MPFITDENGVMRWVTQEEADNQDGTEEAEPTQPTEDEEAGNSGEVVPDEPEQNPEVQNPQKTQLAGLHNNEEVKVKINPSKFKNYPPKFVDLSQYEK